MADERTKALEERDALKYFELCQLQGINPEAPDLHEQGELESILKEREEERYERVMDALPYERFYDSARKVGENEYGRMRSLLQEHFPKFRNKGKQSVKEMTNPKIYGLFRRMVGYSKKRVNEAYS